MTNSRMMKAGRRQIRAFTLAEVVIAVTIVATVLAGMTVAYTQATRRAQWSGYQLAAQALAVQSLDQARAAVWDQTPGNYKNEITNLNLISPSYAAGVWTGYTWTNLDIPISGNNVVRATNFVSVSLVRLLGNTNVQMQLIKVQTVWPFLWGNVNRVYTNSIAVYCAPDNRDPSTL